MKRSAPNKDEVAIDEHPQQITEDANKVKFVEEKISTTVENSTPIKIEKKENKTHIKSESERYDRPCRKGFNLYTVRALIKIGNDKFLCQKVVEEKNEKLANIEYDRMVKKDFGKPKSVTKRACKEDSNGEQDIYEKYIEETPKKTTESKEIIELNRKIELLDTKYSRLYKVTFSKNDFVKDTQYIFARDVDEVHLQIKHILEERFDDDDINYILSKIKNITKMVPNAIKTDKLCLKRLADISIEQLEKTIESEKELEKEIFQQGTSKYQELIDKGFKLFVGKLLPKRKIAFIELARDDDEANLLILAENRTHKAMIAGQKINGAQVGCVEEISKKAEELQDFEEKKFNIESIKIVAQKGDTLYDLLFGEQTVDEYIAYIDNAKEVMEQIKNGKAKNLIQNKLKEMAAELGTENLIDNLLALDRQKKNLFGNNREALRALLNK